MYVSNAAEDSESVDPSDALIAFVDAKQLIRKMHGGSQSILVRGEDGGLYVVKLNDNRQGPNLLANEMLGSELLRAVGLPTPSWKAIFVSNGFLDENPGLRFEWPSGSKKARSGLHFGSRFIEAMEGGEVYDFLPSSFCSRVTNPSDFLGIYIFDVWANHHDHRQALFSCRPTSLVIDAQFIDNGHLFGGPSWDPNEKYGASMCLDRNLYTVPWHESSIRKWVSRFEKSIPRNLPRIISQVPQDWYNGDIARLTESLLARLSNLHQLFRHELQHNRRIKTGSKTGTSNAPMPLRDSRSLPVRPVSRLRSVPVAP